MGLDMSWGEEEQGGGAEAAALQNAELVTEDQWGLLEGVSPLYQVLPFPSLSSSNPESGPILQTHPVQTVSTVGQARPLPTLHL